MNTGTEKNDLRFRDFFITRDGLIMLSFLMALPLFVYWQTTSFEFVWDDKLFYFGVSKFLSNPSFENLAKFWTSRYIDTYYMPVIGTFWLLLMFLSKVFTSGSEIYNQLIFHLASVLLHILNGFMIFFLLQKIIKNRWAVLFGTLLFLLHPIQVQSVSWLSSQRALLGTVFGLASLNVYLTGAGKEAESRRAFIINYLWSTVLLIFAFLSSPKIASIPLLAGVLDYYLFRRPLKDTFMRILPWLVILPVSFLIMIKWSRLEAEFQMFVPPVWANPLLWMDSISFYLYKITWPVSLAASYARTPEYLIGQWWFYLLPVIPLSFAYLLWRLRNKYPALVLAFVVFVTGYLPASGLLPFPHQYWSNVADRYIYISMAGVSLVFAYLLSVSQRRSVWLFSGIIILFMGIRSYAVQVPTWQNNFTLWDHCIKITPQEFRAYYNRGIYYQKQKKYYNAIDDYSRSISIEPRMMMAYSKRGNLHAKFKKFDMALKDFNRVLELSPQKISAYYNRGNIYFELGQFDRSIDEYSKALKINREYKKISDVWRSRGLAYKQIKEYNKAIEDFNRALTLKPDDEISYVLRGIVHEEMGKFDNALGDYTMVLKINPNNQRIQSRKEYLLKRR